MKKQNQLGMNPSTASNRLVKDLLFKYVIVSHPNCYRCGEPLTRDTFSIEHKTPWLDSENPLELFFDLDNIAFSHQACNSAASSYARPSSICGDGSGYRKGCRCVKCKEWARTDYAKHYTVEGRKERYLRTGR